MPLYVFNLSSLLLRGLDICLLFWWSLSVYYHLPLFCMCMESVFDFKTYWLIDYIMSACHKLFCCEKIVLAEHERDK
jgi:hypothetical protein